MKKLNFKGMWRDYQKRILDNLSTHLSDDKLHIVAAPGAGKTVLGIEVISRINKPTLIFSPTITIKNQWKQKIKDLFLDTDVDETVSTNIKEPKYITVTTYQALLAAFCGMEENNEDTCNDSSDEEKTFKNFNEEKAGEIIKKLQDKNIEVLCFDEAHHLRKEWWKALTFLITNLKPKQTISLTATPPYDVDKAEWERYEQLCGEIDEEISIPELVKNGDLCPHQDFIHFSVLKENESKLLEEQLAKINSFIITLAEDPKLQTIVSAQLEQTSVETILDDPKIYVSVMAYLKAVNQTVSENILKIFDFKFEEIPDFTSDYQKLFIVYLLKLKEKLISKDDISHVENILKQARTTSVLINKNVVLNDSPKIRRQIASSTGKIESVKEIVDLETNTLKEDLRMVVLADNIKENVLDFSELGVIPIWQALKDKQNISLAVLTGSIILINKKIEDVFKKAVKMENIEDYIGIKEYENDKNYIKVTLKGSKKSKIVNIITEIFNKGHITVLVGTQALLGEGWDAPCINSLILSSTVSTYMLSNQMRGRAIRIDKNNPNKISNIWHLASIKILTLKEKILQSFSQDIIQDSDYRQLIQRFMGFEAPSLKMPFYIQNGIERILPDNFLFKLKNKTDLTEEDFLSLNKIFKEKALNRQKTKDLWEQGLNKNKDERKIGLKTGIVSSIDIKTFRYTNWYWTQFFFVFCLCSYLFERADEFGMILSCVLFVIIMLPSTLKYIFLSDPNRIIKVIGTVFLDTLYEIGEIKTNRKFIEIKTEFSPEMGNNNSLLDKLLKNKEVFFTVAGFTSKESKTLINCISEFLNPVENPRYLFIRKDSIFNNIKTTDYHSLPSVISQKRKNVEIFKKIWKKRIGRCNIIYTRTPLGRRILLKARKNSFSSNMPTAKKLTRYE